MRWMGLHKDPGNHSLSRCWRSQRVPSVRCHPAPAEHSDVHGGMDSEQRGVWLRVGSTIKKWSPWIFHLFSWRELTAVSIDPGLGLTVSDNST